MRLQRLIVQGFKSFKDRTVIEFDDGITGIVGPNGCGKSNIVDALFWVMGEQSAKHLRGSQMKDLIFSGSSKYSPSSYAEVTLVLENTNGKHIHISGQVAKPLEIQLTRKLYRNGETEYRINGEQARLKDIQEVFMDTGAGAKSYSIIAQGEINKLVQAKPEERRVMIEEVAGITKFKLRKRDSLKKIEQTQQNLSRLEDLQAEIYKNLKNLEKQAEKAERARTLRERIKKYELSIESHREVGYVQDYVNAHQILESRKEEIQNYLIMKNQIELVVEEEKIQKVDMMSKLEDTQDEFNLHSKELAAAEEKLKHFKKSLVDKNNLIESRTKENEELAVDLEDRKIRLSDLQAQLQELENNDYGAMDFSDKEEMVEILKNQLFDLNEKIDEKRKELTQKKESLQNFQNDQFKMNSRLEEYARLLQDLNVEIEGIEKSSTNLKDDLLKEKEKFKVTQAHLQNVEKEKVDLQAQFDEVNISFNKVSTELNQTQKILLQKEMKLSSLKEINAQAEGFREEANIFLENNKNDQMAVLGDLIICEPIYTKAIQSLLDESLESILPLMNRGEFADLLKKTDQSFNTLFPFTGNSNSESFERLKLQGAEGLIPLKDVIKVIKPEYQEGINQLLDGFYLVENLNESLAAVLSFDLNFKGLVSYDGFFILKKTPQGMFWGKRSPSLQMGMGVVERNNLILDLEKEVVLVKEQFDKLTIESETLNTSFLALKEKLSVLNQTREEAAIAFATIKASLDAREKSDDTSSSRLAILLKRRDETSVARLNLLENEEKLDKGQEGILQTIKDIENELENLESAHSDLKISFENSRDELMELKIKSESYESQLKNLRSQVSDIEGVLERYEQKLASNKLLLEKSYDEVNSLEDESIQLEKDNRSKAEDLSDREQLLSLMKDQLSQILVGMQEKESKLKDIQHKLNKIDKENVELELKCGQIVQEEELLVKNIFEKYQVDLRSIAMTHLEVNSQQIDGLKDTSAMFVMASPEGEIQIEIAHYEFDKKFPGEIRDQKDKLKEYKSEFSRLGEINWQAIEDYDRQKLRFDFLKSQEEELKKSLNDLQVAITHIDEKSRERFKEAFSEVNARFTKVFPIIFGGGSAQLEVVGDLDSAECGVDIIAQPPGKKMQSITLMSGGEKAMTAVSLIFSIFLVKPSPFCLLDEVDAPLDDANVGRFNELLREMSTETQFILITHNKKTMELNDTLYGVTMQEPGVSNAVSVQLH